MTKANFVLRVSNRKGVGNEEQPGFDTSRMCWGFLKGDFWVEMGLMQGLGAEDILKELPLRGCSSSWDTEESYLRRVLSNLANFALGYGISPSLVTKEGVNITAIIVTRVLTSPLREEVLKVMVGAYPEYFRCVSTVNTGGYGLKSEDVLVRTDVHYAEMYNVLRWLTQLSYCCEGTLKAIIKYPDLSIFLLDTFFLNGTLREPNEIQVFTSSSLDMEVIMSIANSDRKLVGVGNEEDWFIHRQDCSKKEEMDYLAIMTDAFSVHESGKEEYDDYYDAMCWVASDSHYSNTEEMISDYLLYTEEK